MKKSRQNPAARGKNTKTQSVLLALPTDAGTCSVANAGGASPVAIGMETTAPLALPAAADGGAAGVMCAAIWAAMWAASCAV